MVKSTEPEPEHSNLDLYRKLEELKKRAKNSKKEAKIIRKIKEIYRDKADIEGYVSESKKIKKVQELFQRALEIETGYKKHIKKSKEDETQESKVEQKTEAIEEKKADEEVSTQRMPNQTKLMKKQKAEDLTDRKKILSVTILLFYTYINPVWTKIEQDQAVIFCRNSLQRHGCTGRLRVAREGLNSVLTGTYDAIRAFTSDIKAWKPEQFANTDFKYVDRQPDNHKLRILKVWPVAELVTYGFNADDAKIQNAGKHLTPKKYHKAMELPNTVMVDVRNFNETVIGKFAPPGVEVLDPCMRKSTEFPKWVDDNMSKLKGKKILMYCTGGIRCEKASAFLSQKGLDVNQLQGGIHGYLDQFPEDGGYWVGQNYTFDKRFSHGAKKSECQANCVICTADWERYQAGLKCQYCNMEIIICRKCQAAMKTIDKRGMCCSLCLPKS